MILKGWKYGLFITGMVGVLGAAMYPIVIAPMIDSTSYSKLNNWAYFQASELFRFGFLLVLLFLLSYDVLTDHSDQKLI